MSKDSILRRHARLFSFFGVLLLTSGLVVLLFQEARAVDMRFVSPPTTIGGGSSVFTAEIVVPANTRIPITGIEAILEQQLSGRPDKSGAFLLAKAECPMIGVLGSSCPASAPLVQGGPNTGAISAIVFVGAFGNVAQPGYEVTTTQIFDSGTLEGTRTGYGYDSVSSLFAQGLGYGYGYNTGDLLAFNIGTGYGYGYGQTLFLRFEVTINGGALTQGTFYLTVLAKTGSPVIGDLSSPFTEFTNIVVSGGGGGGGGGAGGSFGSTISGSTATSVITGTAGGTVSITLGTINGFQLGTLSFTLGTTVTNVNVQVTVSTTPTEGAIAVPVGFDSVIYLSIIAPPGTIGGGGATLTFTLSPAQLAGHAPETVTMLHFVNGAWVVQATTLTSKNADGSASFSAVLTNFSPFAIVFDTQPPTITNLRPPEAGTITTKGTIGATVNDNRAINASLARLSIDGQAVAATLSGGDLLYSPPVALTVGSHTATVNATDLSGLTTVRSWTFNAIEGCPTKPTVTPVSPPIGGFTNNNLPVIAASYVGGECSIDTTKVVMVLDGAVVAPVVTLTSATFTPAAALQDGKHNVRVEAADTTGNSNFAAWDFTVDTVAPVISAVEPADGGSAGARPTLKATYSDALSGIDPSKVTMTLDGKAVTPQAGAGQATFTPPSDLAEGRHTASVTTTDLAGNTATKQWTFTTSAAGAGGMGALIIVLVVLILIVVGAVYYFRTRKKPGTGAPPPPP